MSTWLSVLWKALFIATLSAQNEEMFYWYKFEEQLDWIVDVGSYDATIHTYIPIEWVSSGRCPRLTRCMHAMKDGSISSQISTVGFHSIRLQIDVVADGVEEENGDWCVMQYRSASASWVNVNILQGADASVLDYSISIPDNSKYNDQLSFKVKVAIAASAGGDNCYFDNLKVFGIPYTSNPTRNPSHAPSFQPTLRPTIAPSVHLTINPSPSPTNPPTQNPTVVPTKYPTTTVALYSTTVAPYLTLVISTTKTRLHALAPHIPYNVYIVPVSLAVLCLMCFALVLVVVCCVKKCKAAEEMMQKEEHVQKTDESAIAYDNKATSDNEDSSKTERDNDDVRQWLEKAVKLPQYFDLFIQNGYDCLEFIQHIEDESELVQMGVKLIGHQVRIMTQINLLKAEDHVKDVSNIQVIANNVNKPLDPMPQVMPTNLGLDESGSDIDIAIAIKKGQLFANAGDKTEGFMVEDLSSDED